MFRVQKCTLEIWVLIIILVGAVYPVRVFPAQQELQARLEDGAVLKVHVPEDAGRQGYAYARQVLRAACEAYQEIVFTQEFNRPGYTFAQPANYFAYDSDRSIDIYMKQVEAPSSLMQHQGGLEYKAKVFIPLDYRQYQRWYRIEEPQLELKAGLVHELLHAVIFSYNRNMHTSSRGRKSLTGDPWDWYTEGLARYFETLAGYREEFLSAGFRRRVNGKIITYKGGVNYFLKYPDEPLNERKYDFALFWQYLHENYGMDKIEEITAEFRQVDPRRCTNQEAMQVIARTLGVPLKDLIGDFSLYVYKRSSLPEGDRGLKPVSVSKLSSPEGGTSGICSFGFDFYEIDLNGSFESIRLQTVGGRQDLNYLLGIRFPSKFTTLPVEPESPGKMKIKTGELPEDGKLVIMLSNPTDGKVYYRISFD